MFCTTSILDLLANCLASLVTRALAASIAVAWPAMACQGLPSPLYPNTPPHRVFQSSAKLPPNIFPKVESNL